MDAGGRATHGAVAERRNKIILFCKMLFSLFLKVKRIGKKEFILTSPHPTLSSRRGLQRCVYCFYAK